MRRGRFTEPQARQATGCEKLTAAPTAAAGPSAGGGGQATSPDTATPGPLRPPEERNSDDSQMFLTLCQKEVPYLCGSSSLPD